MSKFRKIHYVSQCSFGELTDMFYTKKLGFNDFKITHEIVDQLIPKISLVKHLSVYYDCDIDAFKKLMINSNIESLKFNHLKYYHFRNFEQTVYQLRYLTKLKLINCELNFLTLIEFFSSTTTQLTSFEFCVDVYLTSLFDAIGKYAKRNQNLQKLKLSINDEDNLCGPTNFGTMFQDLAHSNICQFSLSVFEFDGHFTKELQSFLQRSQLRKLYLDMVVFSDSSIDALRKMFSNTKLHFLFIGGHNFMNDLVSSIRNIPSLVISSKLIPIIKLFEFNQLTMLTLFDCANNATPELFDALLKQKSMKKLHFSIGDNCLKEFNSFVRNCNFPILKVNTHCNICIDLTESLSKNVNLRCVTFYNFEKIGDVASIIKNNKTLVSLVSQYTKIDNEDQLLNSLASNTIICNLVFQNLSLDFLELLARNERIRTFSNERLWKLCFLKIKDRHLIPQSIVDQWNDDHPDKVHRVVITSDPGNFVWSFSDEFFYEKIYQ